MANNIKFCSCPNCRAGRHKAAAQHEIKRAIRKNRRDTKKNLKNGTEVDNTFSVPYTD